MTLIAKVEESRVEELTNRPQGFRSTLLWHSTHDFLTSRIMDFLSLSFVIIDIPGLFRKKAISSQLSAVSFPLAAFILLFNVPRFIV